MNRERRFELMFTQKEYRLLCELAENDPDTKTRKTKEKNISAYIRKKIFEGTDRPQDLKKELENLNYQVRKIGVNINQVTVKINSSYANPNDIKILENHLHDVEIGFMEMIRKIEETYGDYEDP